MKEQPTRVLIIDDEIEAAELLGMHLNRDGYEVLIAASGPEGLKLAFEHQPEAVVLDIRLPGMDGLEVCGRLRDISDAAIVFLTVVGDADQIVRGLQLGADDCITKPVAYRELAARLEACLRRRVRRGGVLPAPGPAGFLWKVDELRREVEIGGRRAQLTPKEYEVFKLLMQNPDQVLAADEILKSVWGAEYLGDTELVKQFMYRLRAKLEANPSEPRYLVTVRGAGYAFEPDTQPAGKGQAPAAGKVAEPPVGGVSEFRQQAARAYAEAGGSSLPASATAKTKPSLRQWGRPAGRPRSSPRWIGVALVVPIFAIILFVGGLLALAATRSLPGEPAYPVKVLLEQAWLMATFDRERDLTLRLEFLDRRVAEISRLVESGRAEYASEVVGQLEGQIGRASVDLDSFARTGETRPAQLVKASMGSQIENLRKLRDAADREFAPTIDRAIEASLGLQIRAESVIGTKESGQPSSSVDGKGGADGKKDTR